MSTIRQSRLSDGVRVAAALLAAVAAGCGSDGASPAVSDGDAAGSNAPDSSGSGESDGDASSGAELDVGPDQGLDAGGGEGPDTPDGDAWTPPPRQWQVMVQDLPGAVLSAWRSPEGDVWMVGARGKGTAPVLLRRSSGEWTWVDAGHDADLWAVHGAGSQVWIAGDGGLLGRVDGGVGPTSIDTGTDATLFGVWAASATELWAVGGPRVPGAGAGVALRVVGDMVHDHTAELPGVVGQGAPLLAVWGRSSEDVWMAGEAGVVAHWDGGSMAVEVLPGQPRISAISGAPGGQDVVLVGGLGDGRVWRRVDGGWFEMAPAHQPHLGGVGMDGSGRLVAAGLLGAVLEWDEAVGWSQPAAPPWVRDWRSAWWSGPDTLWVAGGALLDGDAYDDGAALCLGPVGACGEAAPLLSAPGAGVGPSDLDASAGVDGDVDDDAEGAGDLGPTDDSSVAPPDGFGDAGAGPQPSDGPLKLELGVVAEDSGFTPVADGVVTEIVQGAQGFIHLELGIRFVAPGLPEPDAFVAASGTATIGGEEVAFGTVPKLPVTGADGVYTSRPALPLLLVFANGEADSSPYLGDPPVETLAEACVTVQVEDGLSDTLCRVLSLVDDQ